MGKRKRWERVLVLVLALNLVFSGIPASTAMQVRAAAAQTKQEEDISQPETDVQGEEAPAQTKQEADSSRPETGESAVQTPVQTEEGAGDASGGTEETETQTPSEGGETERPENPEESGEPEETEPQDPVETETPAEDSEEEEANPEDFEDQLTLEELEALEEDEVGATIWQDPVSSGPARVRRMAARDQGDCSIDVYYINEQDTRHVDKTDNFNLKYQMEFHTSRTLEQGTVEIRIPAALVPYRDAKYSPLPAAFAIPEGTPDDYTEARNSPFNYYIDKTDPDTKKETDDQSKWQIVFFNYKKISAGTNAAWQVLYRNLDVMEIKDGTTWSCPAVMTVSPEEGEEEESEEEKLEQKTEPLSGRVDTYVELTSVSKKPYTSGKSYTPALYTEKQVKEFAGLTALPAQYAGDNFQNWRFVVWEIIVQGKATQPWNLSLSDTPGSTSKGRGVILNREQLRATEKNKSRSLSQTYRVVVAYPKTDEEFPVLTNDVNVTVTPYDRIDPSQSKSASAKWTYQNYEWKYYTRGLQVQKGSTQTYKGGLELCRYILGQDKDYGPFSFTTASSFRGYHWTHAIKTENGETVGDYREGTSYELVTMDDFMYAQADNQSIPLNGDDYYFTKISVTQKDTGYDVWEDTGATPELAENVDQDVHVYVMYRGSNTWELLDTISWNASGSMSRTYGSQDFQGEPWRVMVRHKTVNYSTACSIDVDVNVRKDGKFAELVKDEQNTFAALQDVSGGTVIAYKNEDGVDVAKDYWPVSGGNSVNETVKADTEGLYSEGNQTMEGWTPLKSEKVHRDTATKTLQGVEEYARASKTSSSTNDVVDGRVLVNYTLTAEDGYNAFSREVIDALKANGKPAPGGNQVVFYDLIPYGMQFDPSSPVKAFRGKDASQVTVHVDSEKDIIENFNGTGRTLVIFHISYAGADPSIYEGGTWKENWSLNFQTYYDWKDMNVAQAATNICAFMPEDARELLGADNPQNKVCKDDGKDEYGKPLTGALEPFSQGNLGAYLGLSDAELEARKNLRNVLYAGNKVGDQGFLVASESSVKKLVRADSDRFGVYQESAVVEAGQGYTYDVTVQNQGPVRLTNIVVYDRLERAIEDREEIEKDPNYDFWMENPGLQTWTGTFQEVVKTGLEDQLVDPVIYYSNHPNAPITSGELKPEEILTEENGWIKEKEFLKEHDLSEVKMVAVDLSKTVAGTEFGLDNMESVTFQIKMKAPTEEEAAGALYAFNNASFYSFQVGNQLATTESGDSVKVALAQNEILEVTKEFANVNQVPASLRNSSFEFYLYQEQGGKKVPFANQEYELWVNGEKKEDRLYATDGSGRLNLRAGEKAVFPDVPDAKRIQVEEQENPFWEVTYQQIDDPEQWETRDNKKVRTVTVSNVYRPVLYVQKNLQGVPKSAESTANKETFTFQIEADGKLLSNREFWYVDSVRLDGGIPSKVTTLGKKGIGKTDENGQFTIKKGEIIALFPGKEGTKYTLTEILPKDTADSKSNWVCTDKIQEGFMAAQGNQASITNYYRWKDLMLTKAITHQDRAGYQALNPEFTFRIEQIAEEGNGMLEQGTLVGKEWVLLDENGKETDIKGTLGSVPVTDGETVSLRAAQFTCACAGKTIQIKGLEQGKTYRITEVGTKEPYSHLYRPVNDTEEVTLPLYSGSAAVTITNDYLMRPLSVTKMVIYDSYNTDKIQELETKTFTMTAWVQEAPLAERPYILKNADGSVIPALDADGAVIPQDDPAYPYRTDEEGCFILKHGQTAVFQDAGMLGDSFEVTESADASYPQIYPANGGSHLGNLSGDGGSVTFLNGTKGNLLISKEYIGGDLEGERYAAQTKSNASVRKDAAVTFTLEVTNAKGQTYLWPNYYYQSVRVIDQMTGKVTYESWPKNGSITVEPWKTIVVSPGSDFQSYTLTESETDQHRLLQSGNSWLEISQKISAGDGSMTGTVKENPFVVFYNEVKSVKPQGSLIEKRLALGSDFIEDGAKLVWRLEEYKDGRWSPKQGVSYLILDDAGAASDRVLETGENGEILLEKTANGCPKVHFITDTVQLNQYDEDVEEGSLRLVEVSEKSDEAWGVLIGYGREGETGEDYSMNLDPAEAVAFVNSNRTTPVEIAKTMRTASDETFTMILKQVLSMSEENITKSEARQGVSYTVYDAETGEQQGEARETGKNGEILLRAGQYARLELPDKTQWTVSEELTPTAPLKEMSGHKESPGRLEKLEDNLMLIQPEAEAVPGKLEVHPKKRWIDAGGREITVDQLLAEVVYSDGKRVELSEEEYKELKIERITWANGKTTTGNGSKVSIPYINGNGSYTNLIYSNADRYIGLFDIEVSWNGLKGGTEMYLANSIRISSSLTLLDAETKEAVNLKGSRVEIPEYVVYQGQECHVTGLGSFGGMRWDYDGTTLEELIMPDSVTTIGNSCFINQKSLKTIQWSKNLKSIGDSAFRGSTLMSVELPEGFTSLDRYVFRDCTGLKKVKLPSSLSTIPSSAFEGCTGLEEVELSDGLKTITYGAFYGCSSLKSIEIPESVTKVYGRVLGTGANQSAFENCTSLESVKLPSRIEAIEPYLFSNCKSLKNIEIPAGVKSIDEGAFRYTGLTSITLPDGLTNIGKYAFDGCAGLTSIEIPSGVTSINDYAFRNTGLTSITLPDGLTNIGNGTFSSCAGLTGIEIPAGVESIGSSAFSGCKGLTSVEVPVGVTSIGSSAFSSCTNLMSIEIPTGVTSIGDSTFSSCTNLTSVVLPDDLESIGKYAFYYCTGLTNIEIPAGVTSIGSNAFYNCKGLTSIKIPAGVTSIGESTFASCSSLTSIELPEGVTSIGSNAFYYCTELTSITIPDGVTTIGWHAFYYCKKLESIRIPASVTSMSSDTFNGCDSLTSIIVDRAENALAGAKWGAYKATVTWTGTE